MKRLMRKMGEGMSAVLEKEGITNDEQLADLLEADRRDVYDMKSIMGRKYRLCPHGLRLIRTF